MNNTLQRREPTETWALSVASVACRAYLGLAVGFAMWALLPLLLGWHSTVVTSGSMSPLIPTGSIIVSSPVEPKTLRPGNVILFVDPADPARLISHRMVGADPQGKIITRGDANRQADSTPLPTENVRGLGRLLVPYAGQPYLWAKTGAWVPLGAWAFLSSLAVAIVLLSPGGKRHGERARRRAQTGRPVLAGTASATALLLIASVAVAHAPAGTTMAAAAFSGTTSNPNDTFVTDPNAIYGPVSYSAAVLADSPSLFWKLDEPAGPTAANSGSAKTATGTYTTAGVTYGVTPNSTPRETGTAVALNGTTGCVIGTQQVNNPTVFTVELWFKTTTTVGGRLLGFGNATVGGGNSTNYDRHLYMTNNGRVAFGTYNPGVNVVITPQPYNDGAWHLAAATIGPGGTALYIDGVSIVTSPTTLSQVYKGYWRVGCENLSGWGATQPTSFYFGGEVDNVAVYPTALTPAQIAAHWNAS